MKRGAVLPRTQLRPSRIEVDLRAIRRNVARLRELSGTEVCAVVKAEGYGHGGVEVARAALEAGASWLAVALVEEGLALRAAGVDAPVLVLSEPPVAAIRELLDARLTPVAYRAPYLAALDAAGHQRGRRVPVHLKLDTGMARVGVPQPAWEETLRQLARARGLELEGLATHLARAEELGVPTTREQLAAFDRGLELAASLGLAPREVHAANTAGALAHPAARYTLIRAGIGVYGLSPGGDVDAAEHGLVPALRLVSEVANVRRLAAGTPVSYGHRWRAPSDGWLATLPIGYADGVPRALTNRAQVLLRGERRPLVGTVCMDMVMVWCGDDEPEVGEEVVLLGRQARPPGARTGARTGAADGADAAADTSAGRPGAERVRVEEWAAAADTITYEIVTQLTHRLPRHHRG